MGLSPSPRAARAQEVNDLRSARIRARFDLQVERVRARLLQAQADKDQAQPAASAAAAEHERIARTLAQLSDGDAPDLWLARRCGLSPALTEFLWTALAVTTDPRVLPLARVLCGAESRRGVTLAFHAAAFGLDGVRARALAAELDEARPARRWRLLVPAEEGLVRAATPFTVPERVAGFLRGDMTLDPMVARCGGVVEPPASAVLDDEQRAGVDRLEQLLEAEEPLLVIVEGPRGNGRRSMVALAAAGRPVLALDLGRWDPSLVSLEALVTSWRRECLLAGAVPLLCDLDVASHAERHRLGLLVDDFPGVVAATASSASPALPVRRPLVRVPVRAADATTRRSLWAQMLGADAAGADLELLARLYRLGAGGVHRAIHAARAARDEQPLDTPAVVAGVRASLTDRLNGLAARVEVTQRWADLVLPEEIETQVKALVARVRHGFQVFDRWGFQHHYPRGQGVAALLSGPPGTGKTMVAGLVAAELGLDLLQVDLSQVVSKWVGETEKQLASVFDAAEAGHTLLLFDEADALFARRTEVKAAVDRYANLEVNYLLQRIEAFGGVVILTTNLETGIDPAVKRRLAAHITFWPPDEDERARLWGRMIPAEAPIEGAVDARTLARTFPDMTGANIRNAVTSAAFLAAADGRVLSQALLEQAGRGEYHNMGRVLAASKRR